MIERFSVKECLQGYTNEVLDAMCVYWRLDAGNKPVRIGALERVLCDELHLKQSLERLSAPALRLLALLAERPFVSAADALGVSG